jgi:2-phosphosulfolactate phosphatase
MQATSGADVYDQTAYPCRLEWGRRGVRAAAERGDVVVVVDVLSFTTAVVTAAARGAFIYPCDNRDEVPAVAARVGGEAAVGRESVPSRGKYSLSPAGYLTAPAGTKVACYSPNGATCARYAGSAAVVIAGAFVNAGAVARAAVGWCGRSTHPITVVACGERWVEPNEDGAIRIAVEDYLGAGAILSKIALPKSPEADVCARAFEAAKHDLLRLLHDCGSGRELCARGFSDDVEEAARLDAYGVVPVLREGRFQPL